LETKYLKQRERIPGEIRGEVSIRTEKYFGSFETFGVAKSTQYGQYHVYRANQLKFISKRLGLLLANKHKKFDLQSDFDCHYIVFNFYRNEVIQ